MKKLTVIFTVAFLFALAACTSTPTPPPVITPTATSTPTGPVPIASPQLTRFYFFNEREGWGATQDLIVRTSDGGRTWVNATPNVDAQFGYLPFIFVDAQTAWALVPISYFDSGALYQTADGGVSWKSVSVPFAVASLQALDSTTAFALASLGAGAGSQAVAFYQSTDGGHTWTRLFINDPNAAEAANSLPLGGSKGGFAFNDALNGWVGGSIPVDDKIFFYRSVDGGVTWSEYPLSLPAGYEIAQTSNNGPLFFSAAEGILPVHFVMPTQTGGLTVFYRTSNGGATWTPGQVINDGRLYDFRSFREGVAFSGGQFFFTSDSGQTWGAVTPNMDFTDSLDSFQFANNLVGWALINTTGADPAFYMTTDGGVNWTRLIE
jgi:photosystem II stability/assembly factor-like uncharacterized protein